MLPPVSVLMPSYNRAHLIRDSIGSVLRQTHSDFELIIYDDGSDDPTESVVRSIADPRIRYCRGAHNRGVAAARNELLQLARHPIACWQDSDDLSNIHRLQRQLELLELHPMVLSTFVWLDRVPANAWVRPPRANQGVPSHPSAMFRVDREILCDLKFSISGEDINWTTRMQAAHGPYFLDQHQLYYNRNHPHRIGHWKRTPELNLAWYERMRAQAGQPA
jgi:glycosyltransferase involved in cell wall biosynthesis